MTHHLVREAIALGGIPICPDDHVVGGFVLAAVQGTADPNKWGHKWVERGQPIWCISQVIPAEQE